MFLRAKTTWYTAIKHHDDKNAGVNTINLTEFGLLVKALRKYSMDEYGNRWTRETLSEAIHLTPNQLGRLERGDRKYLDNQTLTLLSNAFKLTNLEQQEFFMAASSLKDEVLFQNETPEDQLNNLLGSFSKTKISTQ